MRVFAQIDADGFPLGFYPADMFPEADGQRNPSIPEGAVEITYDQWMQLRNAASRTLALVGGELVQRPAPVDQQPVISPQIDSWGLARFTVAAGVLTPTGDAKNIAGVLRLGTGKYRICLDAPPEALMAFPFALDPSNDRRAFPASRNSDRFEIRVANAAGALCDAAEVYVEFKRMI